MTAIIKNKTGIDEKPFRVGLSTADGIVFFPANTIMRCKALNNYTRFYFADNRPMLVCHTLGYFEARLIKADFIRIHRSEMVNKNFISKYSYDGKLWLTDGSFLVVSRRRKRGVLNAIAC